MLSPKIETERLILRRYKETDIEMQYKILTDRRLSKYIKFPNYLLNDNGYYLVECSCNELNTQSSKVMLKAGFKKDGYIANRRLNEDGTYSGVEYYSKRKN